MARAQLSYFLMCAWLWVFLKAQNTTRSVSNNIGSLPLRPRTLAGKANNYCTMSSYCVFQEKNSFSATFELEYYGMVTILIGLENVTNDIVISYKGPTTNPLNILPEITLQNSSASKTMTIPSREGFNLTISKSEQEFFKTLQISVISSAAESQVISLSGSFTVISQVSSSESSGISAGVIYGIVGAALVAFTLLVIFCYCVQKKRRRAGQIGFSRSSLKNSHPHASNSKISTSIQMQSSSRRGNNQNVIGFSGLSKPSPQHNELHFIQGGYPDQEGYFTQGGYSHQGGYTFQGR